MNKRIILLFIFILPMNLSAETAYVSDSLEITMRSGQSIKQRILAMLKSGTQVEVLSTNPTTGYTRVRTPEGRTGYVLTRFLMDEPSARDKLEKMTQKINELQAAPGEIRSRLTQLQEDYERLQNQHNTQEKEKETIALELAGIKQTAANSIKISRELTQLRKQMAQLQKDNSDLQHKNRELVNNQNQRWFIYGGGAVFLSVLLGWLLPYFRIRRKSRSSWSDL